MTPEMAPCESSNIRARGFDGGVLSVQFIGRKGNTDTVYQYLHVPESLWIGWLHAASVGGYFAAEIKGKFTAVKVQ